MARDFRDDEVLADLSEDDVDDAQKALVARLRNLALTDPKKPWPDVQGLWMICHGHVGDTYDAAPTIGGWLAAAAKKMGLAARD